MTPGNLPLAIYRGDTYTWRFVLWADTTKTTPADLTGSTAKAEFRTTPGGTLLSAMDLTITTPNIIDGVLTADNSHLLKPPTCYWDLQITYPAGEVQTILAGKVAVTMDVTDSLTDSSFAMRRIRAVG